MGLVTSSWLCLAFRTPAHTSSWPGLWSWSDQVAPRTAWSFPQLSCYTPFYCHLPVPRLLPSAGIGFSQVFQEENDLLFPLQHLPLKKVNSLPLSVFCTFWGAFLPTHHLHPGPSSLCWRSFLVLDFLAKTEILSNKWRQSVSKPVSVFTGKMVFISYLQTHIFLLFKYFSSCKVGLEDIWGFLKSTK